MKNIIRRWLGLDDYKDISRIEMRKMIGEALNDLLNGKADNEHGGGGVERLRSNSIGDGLCRSDSEQGNIHSGLPHAERTC